MPISSLKTRNSIKRTTTVIKKLKQTNEGHKEGLLDDLRVVNLSKLVSDAVTAILDAKFKSSDIIAVQVSFPVLLRFKFDGVLVASFGTVRHKKEVRNIQKQGRLHQSKTATTFIPLHLSGALVTCQFVSMKSTARLFKEYQQVQRDKGGDNDIQLTCDDTNIYRWTAHIKGPTDTPYQEGVFELSINVPELYPLVPPRVRFVTKIFHPNVHFKTGEICLDILKTAWSPAWMLQSVCRAVIALLAHPEADSPLNCDAGNLLRSGDNRGYRSMSQMYTRLCAVRPNSN